MYTVQLLFVFRQIMQSEAQCNSEECFSHHIYPQNPIYSFNISLKINFLFSLHVELTSSFSSVLQESDPSLTHCMLVPLGTLSYLLLVMRSLQNHLNYHCYQTECCKHLESFYLEVQHIIHSDYHCPLVAT